MRQEIKKYTLNDLKYIDNILAAFCDKYQKKETIIIGKKEKINFGKTHISQKKIEAFQREGLEVQERIRYGYHRKTAINGMSVEITAVDKNKKDYRKGIVISVLCYGETRSALQADIDRKEKKLIEYLNLYSIPLDRLCVESSLQCEHKFSGMACVSAN